MPASTVLPSSRSKYLAEQTASFADGLVKESPLKDTVASDTTVLGAKDTSGSLSQVKSLHWASLVCPQPPQYASMWSDLLKGTLLTQSAVLHPTQYATMWSDLFKGTLLTQSAVRAGGWKQRLRGAEFLHYCCTSSQAH